MLAYKGGLDGEASSRNLKRISYLEILVSKLAS